MFPGEVARNVRAPVDDKRNIPRMTFTGFKKCLYRLQKFQSDPERRFAVLIENDSAVEKWVKPARASFPVTLPDGSNYEPDFVVEAHDIIYLVEVKSQSSLHDSNVVEKAKAAVTWCKNATDHTAKSGGKPWRYVLIPEDVIQENMAMEWLAKQFGK
jgi:type III restriction enzyme